MKRRRDFRLIPILLVAIGCLAVLKIAGILLDGGYIAAGTIRSPGNCPGRRRR